MGRPLRGRFVVPGVPIGGLMEERELRDLVALTRAHTKTARNVLRTLTALLAQLEEHLDSEPREAQSANGKSTHGRERVGAR